jgi:3-oxoacyl-[acyl-carrier-protein] synthase-3
MKQKLYASIIDIAGYLPEPIITNEDLAMIYPEWSAEKIYDKTGIKIRHIAGIEQTATDLAYQAAINLFLRNKTDVGTIDFIIFCTQSPDYILPTSACVLQQRLGISTNSGAIDINLGCSGYVYALSLAKGLIETHAAKNILLLTADTYSKCIHPMDKSVRTLFGDGATATIISGCESAKPSIGPFVFGTDGRGEKNLIIEAGGYRKPKNATTALEYTDSSGNVRTAENLYMNGAEIMEFSLKEVPKAVNSLLEKQGYTKEDVDFFVFHQANKFMLDALQKKLKIPKEKLPLFLENCGNTVSSSIPFVLENMLNNDLFSEGKQLMLVGFGVGYSWASCFLNFKRGNENE